MSLREMFPNIRSGTGNINDVNLGYSEIAFS